jgi:hypothetical protein
MIVLVNIDYVHLYYLLQAICKYANLVEGCVGKISTEINKVKIWGSQSLQKFGSGFTYANNMLIDSILISRSRETLVVIVISDACQNRRVHTNKFFLLFFYERRFWRPDVCSHNPRDLYAGRKKSFHVRSDTSHRRGRRWRGESCNINNTREREYGREWKVPRRSRSTGVPLPRRRLRLRRRVAYKWVVWVRL